MNPDENVSSSNGLVRNSRGDNNQEESGNGLNNSSTITLKSSIKLSKNQKKQVQKRMWPYGRIDRHTHPRK
jgi:hypothetical protein